MAYQSLYRRYRPRRFSDVRGQEHVIRALRNAVRDERVGHAYLFSGPRGTGKTSTARILAKALNCEHLTDGEPDGTCDSCLAIDAGTSYDVQELDAASNNGVDAIRELISRVALGSPGRTKVYILDEVHMLSAPASAALLKTLEEPPSHVVFVLATTDPQKVLPTIRSRTQHFDFHLLSVEELSEHVAWVIHDADLGLPADVIDHVVRAGAGSARDTLSALDQVAAAGGVVEQGQPLDALLDAIAASDAGAALAALADAISSGRDPRILGEAVLARLRDIFLLRMGGATDHLPPGEIERVQAWADQLGDRATTRALEAVGEALAEMRQAPDPRIPLEVALVKITRVGADVSLDGLLARVAKLEAALASGSFAAAPAPGSEAPPRGSAPAVAQAPDPSAPVPGPAAGLAGTGRADAGSRSGPAGRPVSSGPASGATPSERPAPPPHPRARAADGARAQLAARRGERPASPPRGRASTPESGPTIASTPATDVPAADVPATDVPATDVPATDVPATDAPATDVPGPRSSSAPTDGGPTPAGSARGTSPAAPPTATTPAAASTRGATDEPGSTNSPTAPNKPGPSAPGLATPGPSATGPSAPGPAAPAPGPGGAAPDRDQLVALWNESVLPSLGGLTKAMYAAGRFTEVSGSTAVLALPNAAHRQKCEQKRSEVERAVSDQVGEAIALRLVVDADGDQGDGGDRGDDQGSSTGRGTAQPAGPGDDFDLGGTDVHALDDAPDAPTGGLDALTQAFPGSEFVEGS